MHVYGMCHSQLVSAVFATARNVPDWTWEVAMVKFDIWGVWECPGGTGRTTSEGVFDGLLTGTVVDQPSHIRLRSDQWRGSGNVSGGRSGGVVRQVLSRNFILGTRLTSTVERLLEIRRLHTWWTVTHAGVAFWIGVSFDNGWIFPELLVGIWGTLLGNGLTTGCLAAIAMTLVLGITSRMGADA